MSPPEPVRMGAGFTDEELKIFNPNYNEEDWSRQKRQVIEAAHKKTVERNEYKKQNWEQKMRIEALERECAELKRGGVQQQQEPLLSSRVTASPKAGGEFIASPKAGSEQSVQQTATATGSTMPRIVMDQLQDEISILRQQLQAASTVDVSVAEDDFVARKLAELTRCRKDCAELREALLAMEITHQNLLSENTALKAELHQLHEKEKEKSNPPSRINTPSRMLWAQSSSPSIGIGSLQEFPTLPCGSFNKTGSRSTLTDGSTSVDSASAEMLLKGFERLESVVLSCVKMQDSKKGFHPIAPDASPTAVKAAARSGEWGLASAPAPEPPVSAPASEQSSSAPASEPCAAATEAASVTVALPVKLEVDISQ